MPTHRPLAALRGLAALFAVPLVLLRPVDAQLTLETETLDPVVSSGLDAFGYGLDVAGDRAAVGAPAYDAGTGSGLGLVQTFVRSGSSWVPEQTLFASDGAPGDSFGRAVALEGDQLLVGAPFDDHGGLFSAGAVYVFRHVGGKWDEVAKLVASDPAVGGRYGFDVALDGDLAAIAAPGYQASSTSSEGHAYVLERIGGTWVETQVLLGDLEEADDFAAALDVDGGRIVVGSPYDSANGIYRSGSVYVFERASGVFVETARVSASDGFQSDQLGSAVSLSGDVLASGAPLHDTPDYWRGAIYVHEWDGGAWVERAQLVEPDEVQGSGIGRSVALEGDLLVAQNGTWVANGLTQVGSVVLYRRTPCGFLAEERLFASGLQTFAGFGHALALSGARLVAGGSSVTNDRAYVFDVDPAPAITSYCTAGTTASGCQATVSACGAASASGFGPFPITVDQVEGSRKGLIFFGAAANNAPWGSGSTSYLCVQAPAQRTGVQQSGGALGSCEGVFALDFGAWMKANPGKAPTPGSTAYVQAWFRDPASPKTTSLSDAISFPVAP